MGCGRTASGQWREVCQIGRSSYYVQEILVFLAEKKL